MYSILPLFSVKTTAPLFILCHEKGYIIYFKENTRTQMIRAQTRGDLGEMVSLIWLTSPYFHLRELIAVLMLMITFLG